MVLPTTVLARCTTRLQCGMRATGLTSSGTGFFYSAQIPDRPGEFVFMLVTNKHVVAGCDFAQFALSSVAPDIDVDAVPSVGQVQQHLTELALQAPWLAMHPDAAVDLCALLITPSAVQIIDTGRRLFASFLSKDVEVGTAERSQVRHVERVAMVGYPNGLWDHVNDAPLVRQGCTATHPFQRYQGRSEFVIDMTCLPGSSGSPVFMFEDGMYRTAQNSYSPGTKIALLGVLWGGPQISLEGRIEVKPVPHSMQPVSVTTPSPMNLGYIIHASEIAAVVETMIAQIRSSFSAGG